MSIKKQNQSGFTLVEMLMVILIIAATTKIVAVSTQEFAYSARYEQTQSRLNTLRQAIVGNPKRTIYGQPDISGFVSDMGRLPNNIHELLEKDFCLTDNTVVIKANCLALNSGTGIWTQQPNTSVDFSSNLIYGWNGPYLQISGNPNKTDTYTDGWGNESANNYGWVISADTPTTGDLTIKSLGKDGVNDALACGANTYNGDCKAVILKGDYSIDISSGISAQFKVDYSNICQQDNSTQTACYANAGHWESCLFTAPTQCSTAGGSWASDCRMTQAICTAQGGAWSSSGNPQCVFTSANCLTAGGAWGADGLCHFTASACINMGGQNTKACLFNASSCSGAGKTWNATTHYCSFTPAQCTSDGGIYKANSTNTTATCLRSYKNQSTGLAYDASSCLTDGFVWTGGHRSVALCMRVYSRHNGAVVSTTSSPVVVEEGGLTRQLHFSGFSTTDIKAGINAVGIYKHDGTNCTTTLYPANRTQPLPVPFIPHTHLPVMNW